MDTSTLAAVAAYMEQALDLLARQSLYAAAVAVVVWTVLAVVKPRHPLLHLALWWFVLARLVLPADLATPWSLRSSAETVMAHMAWPTGEPRINVIGGKGSVTPEEARRHVEAAAGQQAADPLNAPAAVTPSVAADARNESVNASSLTVDWLPLALFVFWLGGVVAMTILLVRAERAARLSVSLAEPADTPLYQQLVDAWRERFKVSRPVRLLVTSQATAPFTTGLRSPVIVLPRQLLDRLDDADVSAIIGHEMSHVRSFDIAWRMAERVLLVLFFFHPLVWMAVRRIDTAREACCDLAAAHSGIVDRPAYAKGLLAALKAFRIESEAAFAQTLSIAGGSGSGLKDRLTWLKEAAAMTRRSKLLGGLGLLVLGVMVLPMAQAHNREEPVNLAKLGVVPPAAPAAPAAPAPVAVAAQAPAAPEAPDAPEAPEVPNWDELAREIDAMAATQIAMAEKSLREAERALRDVEASRRHNRWKGVVLTDDKGLRCSSDLLNKAVGENGKVCKAGLTEADKQRINDDMRKALVEARQGYEEAMRESQEARREALAEAREARREALQAAAEARREALLHAQEVRREAVQDALRDAEEARREARQAAAEAMKEREAALAESRTELQLASQSLRVAAQQLRAMADAKIPANVAVGEVEVDNSIVNWAKIASDLEKEAAQIERDARAVSRH